MNTIQANESLVDLVAEGSQSLTFFLEDEQFGIDIHCVQEIRGYSRVTPIPNMPKFVNGAMNLRGDVVPILDLRSRFQMPIRPYDQFTVVIVAKLNTKSFGLVVDAVSDVLNIAASAIEPTPDFGDSVDVSFIKGIAKSGETLITLLKIESLFHL